MAKTEHERGYWKGFFNSFRWGLSCEFGDTTKLFWKYHQSGVLKRSKFRISVEIGDKLVQGFLYYRECSETEAWTGWLKEKAFETYEALEWVRQNRVVTQYNVEQKFPNALTPILTMFGNHDFVIGRKFLGVGKPIVFYGADVPAQELDAWIENELPKQQYGKKAEAVKTGWAFQRTVFTLIKKRLDDSKQDVMVIEHEKYFKVDGHAIRFDLFGIVKNPAFNTPMFLVVEAKNYTLTYKHLTHLLLFDYKIKKVFGNVPVMKFVVCRGAYPPEMFKRAYELGITLLTAYDKQGQQEMTLYPKQRLKNEEGLCKN